MLSLNAKSAKIFLMLDVRKGVLLSKELKVFVWTMKSLSKIS